MLALFGGSPVRTRPFPRGRSSATRKRRGCCGRSAAATGDACTAKKWRNSSGASRRCTAAGTASPSSTAPCRCASRCSRPASRPKTRSSSRPTPSSRPRPPSSKRTRSRCSPTSIWRRSTWIRARSKRRSRRARGRSSRCTSPVSPRTWTRSWPSRASIGLVVIEDAAHAHGASDSGRPAGSIGHMASFSFQSSKNLTVGRRRHHRHERRRARRGVPLDSQLRARARRHLVRAPRHLRQLPPRRIPGRGAERQLDRLEEQTATRDANGRYSRVAPRRAAGPASRRRGRRRARATAITCSCCASTPPRSARRARRCSMRCRPRASPAPPATAIRCPASRCSATRRSARTCADAAARLDYTAQADRCPNSDLHLPRAGDLARTVADARHRATTSTTSRARSRRSTNIATRWRRHSR